MSSCGICGYRFAAPDGGTVSVKVSGNLVSNNAEALRVMALNGQGVILGPSFVVEEDVEAGRLVELLPAWRPVEFAISAIYPHRNQLSSKVRVFIDLVAEHFARHRTWLDLAGQ